MGRGKASQFRRHSISARCPQAQGGEDVTKKETDPSEFHYYDTISKMMHCEKCDTWCAGWDPCACCKEAKA